MEAEMLRSRPDPSCGKPDIKLVSSIPGSLMSPGRGKSTIQVYKCKCGYLFAVGNVEQPPTSSAPAQNPPNA